MKLNNKPYHLVLLACFAAMSSACGTTGDKNDGKTDKGRIHLNFMTTSGSIPIRTWKELRDDKIVKQDRDDSCGAASVATILRSYYGLDVSEKDILDKVEKAGNDRIASFSDLEQAIQSYGFKGVTLSLDYERLKMHELKMPAIVYLHYRDQDHFSVIRGISQDDIVWLGDPSWGNRKFTKYQFRKMRETGERLKGKILLIVPKDADTARIDQEFFGPPTVNRTAIKLLTIRR